MNDVIAIEVRERKGKRTIHAFVKGPRKRREAWRLDITGMDKDAVLAAVQLREEERQAQLKLL